MADSFVKHPRLPYVELRFSTDSDRQYKPHMHKTFCIGAVGQGVVNFRVDGVLTRLEPGNLALINPETLHSCNPDDSCKRNWSMIFLDVAWCLQLQQSLWHLDAFHPVDSALLKDPPTHQLYLDTVASLKVDGEMLEKEGLLAGLAEQVFLKACKTAPRLDEPPGQIETLKMQLSADLEKDLSIREIARDLNVNPYTLLRRFKRVTGMTPHAYRLNCRIERAKKLLQKGLPLSQVALVCGFFDQSHFHRHFKAITMVTPKAYQVNFIQ
ncbi:MAG: helix-turn-helix domain-containing protein [Desulfobacteraceae bacterium]|nr:MAG: helix-turn-helix domain-containing protein [Desulfobacteraceae bacterium]